MKKRKPVRNAELLNDLDMAKKQAEDALEKEMNRQFRERMEIRFLMRKDQRRPSWGTVVGCDNGPRAGCLRVQTEKGHIHTVHFRNIL